MAEGDITKYTQPTEILTMSDPGADAAGFPQWIDIARCAHKDEDTSGIIYQLFIDAESWFNGTFSTADYALVRYSQDTKAYIDFNAITGSAPANTHGALGFPSIDFFQWNVDLQKLVIIWRLVDGSDNAYACSYLSESGGTWSFNNDTASSYFSSTGAQNFCNYFIDTDTRTFVAGVARSSLTSGTLRFYLYELQSSSITVIVDGDQLPSGANTISTSYIELRRGRVTDVFTSMFMYQQQNGDGRLFEIRIANDISVFGDVTVAEVWQEPDVDNSLTFGRLEDVMWDSVTDHIFLWRGNEQADNSLRAQSIIKEIDLDDQEVIDSVIHDDMIVTGYDRDKHLNWNNTTGCTFICGAHTILPSTSRRNFILNLTDLSVSRIHAYAEDYLGSAHETGDYSNIGQGLYDMVNGSIFIFGRLDNSDWADTQHVDLGDDAFFQILEIETDMFYPAGACLLFGISFGEEKDPNFVDFASI